MYHSLSLAFALSLLASTTTVVTADRTPEWLYPALGSYYDGTIDVSIAVFNPKCTAQSGTIKYTYPGVLYIGQPAGVVNPFLGTPNNLETTMIGWTGTSTGAPCTKSSSDITVDFNTSDHTVGYWDYEVTGANGTWNMVAGATNTKTPIPPDTFWQFGITVPACKGTENVTVKWNVQEPAKVHSTSLVLDSSAFSNKSAEMKVNGESSETTLGQFEYWVAFHGAEDPMESDEMTGDNDPVWTKTVNRTVSG